MNATTLAVSVSLLTLLGCGGAESSAAMEPAPPPAESGPADPAAMQELMARVFAQMQDVTQVALSAGDDCDLMADKLEAWGQERDAVLAELAVQVRQIDRKTQRHHLESKLESDPEFGMSFMIAVSTCQEHAGATAAWKALMDKLTR